MLNLKKALNFTIPCISSSNRQLAPEALIEEYIIFSKTVEIQLKLTKEKVEVLITGARQVSGVSQTCGEVITKIQDLTSTPVKSNLTKLDDEPKTIQLELLENKQLV